MKLLLLIRHLKTGICFIQQQRYIFIMIIVIFYSYLYLHENKLLEQKFDRIYTIIYV